MIVFEAVQGARNAPLAKGKTVRGRVGAIRHAMNPAAAALPITPALPDLLAALERQPNAVLVAPPGAGKTTTVPLALLEGAWRGDGRIVMLEPRRLAARAAATRMAFLLGEPVGRTVGYRTRLDAAVSEATRIEVVTEGLLVRRPQSDPGLERVAAVILDEVHERSLDGDLALALCLDLQRGLRPDLRLLAMSATPDTARLAALMQAAVSGDGKDPKSERSVPESGLAVAPLFFKIVRQLGISLADFQRLR